jgi:hypothetical protein
MDIGSVAAAVHDIPGLGEGVLLAEAIAGAVEISNAHGNGYALGVVPRARTYPVASVYGGCTRARAAAKVCAPTPGSRTDSFRSSLTDPIRSCQATEVCAVS